jgi:hypothetical protein
VVLNGADRDTGLRCNPPDAQRVETVAGDDRDRTVDDPFTHRALPRANE